MSWSDVHQKYTQVGSKSITINGTLPRNEYAYLANHEIIDVQYGDILGKGEIPILINLKTGRELHSNRINYTPLETLFLRLNKYLIFNSLN